MAVVVVLALLSASLFALYRSMTRPDPTGSHDLASAAPQTPQQQMADAYSSRGVMSEPAYQRLAGIQTTIYRTGQITPADLQWALALLHSRPVVDSADNEAALHQAVFLYLSGLKPLPQPEENQFFTATAPYTSDKNPFVKEMAAATLGESGDLRALPYLQKMRRDPDPQVQHSAASMIRYVQSRPTQYSPTQNNAAQNNAAPLR